MRVIPSARALPLLGVLLVAALPSGRAAAPAPRDPVATVTGLAEAARVRWDAPGLAVAVVRVGVAADVVVGVGTRGDGSGLEVRPDTPFPVSTASAMVTAVVAARLAERGLLAWDDPVAPLLPVPLHTEPGPASRITLRDLLLHRTGAPPARHADPGHLPPPVLPFRAGYCFNRANLWAAQAVMGRVTGLPWPELLHRELLAPLGIGARSDGDTEGPGAEAGSSAEATPAAERLELSALDLARFFHAELEDRPPLLTDEARRQLRMPGPALSGGPPEAPLTLAAAGGLAQPYRGRRLYWADGVGEGSTAALMVLPDDGLAVGVLAGAAPPAAAVALARQLLDVAFGLAPEPWHDRPAAQLAGPSTWEIPSCPPPPAPVGTTPPEAPGP